MADGSVARVPAQNLEAEAAVLSAAILDRSHDALDRARAVLGSGEDFFADSNRRIWQAVLELDGAGKPIDVLTLRELLSSSGRLAQVGGIGYLGQITDATPAVAHVEAHARIVADKARQRRLVDLAHRIVAEGYEKIEDVRAWALSAAQAVTDLAAQGQDSDPPETLDELMPRMFEALVERSKSGKEFRGIDTGFSRVNQIIGGWDVGMHVLAGRPGMGKTSAVLCSLINVARQGHGAVFLSAEMPKDQLVDRALAVEAHVSLAHIRSGRLNAHEWAAVTAAATRLRKLPISLKYCPGAKVAELRATLRAERRRLPKLGLVAVDYLQILDGERRDGDSRESEVASISKRVLWMTQEFQVPLIAVSQLNRAVESRNNANKRPALSDLRESGAIEQDAHTVNLLYRDEYYNKSSEWAGTLEWIVAKQRNGPTGTARLAFVADSTLVATLADDDQTALPYEDQA